VGSLRYRSFRFVAYSNDHLPRHVHAFFEDAEVIYSNDHLPRHVHAFFEDAEVIIDLRDDLTVAIADRANAYSPKDLKI